jgi:hypothetical protein
LLARLAREHDLTDRSRWPTRRGLLENASLLDEALTERGDVFFVHHEAVSLEERVRARQSLGLGVPVEVLESLAEYERVMGHPPRLPSPEELREKRAGSGQPRKTPARRNPARRRAPGSR